LKPRTPAMKKKGSGNLWKSKKGGKTKEAGKKIGGKKSRTGAPLRDARSAPSHWNPLTLLLGSIMKMAQIMHIAFRKEKKESHVSFKGGENNYLLKEEKGHPIPCDKARFSSFGKTEGGEKRKTKRNSERKAGRGPGGTTTNALQFTGQSRAAAQGGRLSGHHDRNGKRSAKREEEKKSPLSGGGGCEMRRRKEKQASII